MSEEITHEYHHHHHHHYHYHYPPRHIERSLNAIVFFTFQPPKELFEFAAQLKKPGYDIFVSVNDNQYELPEYDKDITIIKLNSEEVKKAGYYNSNNNMREQVSSRDKAFYYFNTLNHTNYKHIWFIEDDVFIPTVKTLQDLDNKYPDGDYLSNSYFVVACNNDEYHGINPSFPIVLFDEEYSFYESWAFKDFNVKNFFPMPWLKGMTCAIRVSRNFLREVDRFAAKHNRLIVDEVFYPSLAFHRGLKIVNPIELTPIVYRTDFNWSDKISNYMYWTEDDIRPDYLFHPIKDFETQQRIRSERKYDKIEK